MFKGLNLIEFSERFATKTHAGNTFEIKWENGYKCGKCSYTHYYGIKWVVPVNV